MFGTYPVNLDIGEDKANKHVATIYGKQKSENGGEHVRGHNFGLIANSVLAVMSKTSFPDVSMKNMDDQFSMQY